MPKKLHFDPDLVRVNISRKAHDQILARKQKSEPFYRIFDRILTSYLENDAADWQEQYYSQVEITQNWIKKFNELKGTVDKKLGEQTKLV
jgi:hypothetical protein